MLNSAVVPASRIPQRVPFRVVRRWVLAVGLAILATVARAERILLIPLDSRPAAGQFAQMIGKMANVDVIMPPYDSLGRFTVPGNPDAILDWLSHEDLSDVDAVVASADMVQYGGLIASRVNETRAEVALGRIRKLVRMVRSAPHVKLYVFSATMRLTPTAAKTTTKYKTKLARYEEVKAKYEMFPTAENKAAVERARPLVPVADIQYYETTRRRNNLVQQQLIRMMAAGNFDYLVVGQDDARPFGPHVKETQGLKSLVASLNIGGKVFFCEGVDQHASVLVSRALLTKAQWTPRIRVVFSDEAGKLKYASFESKPIKDSLEDQILASGARPATVNDNYDYTLYLNTPGRRESRFKEFLSALKSDVDQGFPTAVADIDLAKDGTADPELFDGLWENKRMMKLLAFAGWNTAGNTMGTTIPAANVYLLSRRLQVDPLERETAQREFTLHRFVNDYAYHKFTRPLAYRMIKESGTPTTDEIYGELWSDVNAFVQEDLRKHLMRYFEDQFLDKPFFAGTKQYAFRHIDDIQIFLPWPRAYEVRLDFHLKAEPLEKAK